MGHVQKLLRWGPAAAILAGLAISASAASAATWDISTGFVLGTAPQNTNNTWQYFQTSDRNTFTLLTTRDTIQNTLFDGWRESAQFAGYDIPSVAKNTGANPAKVFSDEEQNVAVGGIWLHPKQDGGVAVGWKSPITGMVDIALSVRDNHAGGGGSDDGVSWYLDLGNSSNNLALGTVYATGTSVDTDTLNLANVAVTSGQFLYLSVMPKVTATSNNYYNDATVVTFTITQVPEPSTLALLAAGLLGLAWGRIRRSRVVVPGGE